MKFLTFLQATVRFTELPKFANFKLDEFSDLDEVKIPLEVELVSSESGSFGVKEILASASVPGSEQWKTNSES